MPGRNAGAAEGSRDDVAKGRQRGFAMRRTTKGVAASASVRGLQTEVIVAAS